jgi:hypothetical protein
MTATAQPHRPLTRWATAMNPTQPLPHDGPPGTRAETDIGASNIGADMSAVAGPLSFWRITHVPFAAWLAALERWQLTGEGSELRFGNSQLRGPAGHDPHFGTCQIEVRLARGALRRPLRMRLDIDHWSATSTALTLIPCQRVRPGTAYFRAGWRLLDSLACAAGTPVSTAASPARQHTPASRPSGHPAAGGELGIPGVRQPGPALA